MTTLSTLQVAQLCLNKSRPLSLKRDIFGSDSTGALSLRSRLVSVYLDCPALVALDSEVEIFKYYFPRDLERFLTVGYSTWFLLQKAAVELTGMPEKPENAFAIQVYAARNTLLRTSAIIKSSGIQSHLTTAYEALKHREFKRSLDALDQIKFNNHLSILDEQTLTLAFHHEDVKYWNNTGQESILHGWNKRMLIAYEREQLHRLTLLLAGRTEGIFRCNMLRAESRLGGRHFQEARETYVQLFARDDLSVEQRRFVALRLAHAHVAYADLLYRRQPSAQQRGNIETEYNRAINLLENNVQPEHPERQPLINYAERQKFKLHSGLNFLGYRDDHVPIYKPEYYSPLAKNRINDASMLTQPFERFKNAAEDLDALQAEYANEIAQANESVKIANDRKAKAALARDIMAERIRLLSDQEDFNEANGTILKAVAAGPMLASAFGIAKGLGKIKLFSSARNFASSEVEFIAAISEQAVPQPAADPLAVIGMAWQFKNEFIGYYSRRNELKHQKQMAVHDLASAEKDITIAQLEYEAANRQLRFIEEKRRFVVDKSLSADQYYALASLYADLIDANVDRAIEWLFLCERAIAFKRLKTLHEVRFDYRELTNNLEDDAALIAAPGKLQDVLNKLIEEDKADEVQHPPHQPSWISLATFYPLEFQQLLQTGEMNFTLSLYDLDETVTLGTYHRRLRAVSLRFIGLMSTSDGDGPSFRGALTHKGSFLLRDRDSLNEADRFVPTDDEIDKWLASLPTEPAQGKVLKGVIPYALDQHSFAFSENSTSSGDDHMPEIRHVFEGYGAAGTWNLRFDEVDRQRLQDVWLKFTFDMPMPDDWVREQVKKLKISYEKELSNRDELDRTTIISLAGGFSDEFQQLRSGQTAFELSNHFPVGLSNLKVKTVVVAVLDSDKDGVGGIELTVSKDNWSITRATNANGFTENLESDLFTIPKMERFSPQGKWHIRMKPEQFVQLGEAGDLMLALIYTYDEVAA